MYIYICMCVYIARTLVSLYQHPDILVCIYNSFQGLFWPEVIDSVS